MNKYTLDALREEYEALWAECEPATTRLHEIDSIIDRIAQNRARYEALERATGVLWVVIAALHNMECGLRFDQHLHNGDPLRAKTVSVPEHRPPGPGPWTWEESAKDALELDGLTSWRDWSVAGCLFKAEGYNGWGSRMHAVRSPYLWGGSNKQQPGKYIRDHVWSATAITTQIGVATILCRMEDREEFVFPEDQDDDPPAAAPAPLSVVK